MIPAYEPDDTFPQMVHDLLSRRTDLKILVIDDGSGSAYAPIFTAVSAVGASVLTSTRNHGKGHALKLGFTEVMQRYPGSDIVTADADGQHDITDILAVAEQLDREHDRPGAAMILGCRAFTGSVPLRSRVGNTIARHLFRIASGWGLSDTQTGLRGIPHTMLPWLLTVSGERFEYEQQVLLRLRSAGFTARELEIKTVYLPGNLSSHFRPIVDSLRVLAPVALFAASSLLAFLVDTAVLFLCTSLTGLLIPSIIVARLTSATVNFIVNRRLVFARRGRGALPREILQYVALALVLLASNIVWMSFLTDAGVPLWLAKLLTEGVLFVTSFGIQRGVIFAPGRTPDSALPENERVTHMVRIGSSGSLRV